MTDRTLQAYMIAIANLFVLSMRFIMDHVIDGFKQLSTPRNKLFRLVDSALQDTIKVWASLWDIRESFFTIKRTDVMPEGSRAHSLYDLLIDGGQVAFYIERAMGELSGHVFTSTNTAFTYYKYLRRKRMIIDPSSRIAHGMYALWIHSSAVPLRRCIALDVVQFIVEEGYLPVHGDRAPLIFLTEMDGAACTSAVQSTRAALRDFKSEDDESMDQLVHGVLRLLIQKWDHEGPAMPSPALDRAYVRRSLAACRTQLCMTVKVQNVAIFNMSFEMECVMLQ